MREKRLKWLSLIFVLVVGFAIVNVAHSGKLPKVYMDPAVISYNPGSTFTVYINVADVVDLFSWGIKIRWERDLLICAGVTEGPFLKSQPMGTLFVQSIGSDNINIGCTTIGNYPGVSGSGTLMTVKFSVRDAGATLLDIYESTLLDSNVFPITHNVVHGEFYTPQAANLVKKSAWPEHHHFVVSKDEDFNGTHANQTLFAKVKNLGPAGYNLYVYAVFELVRDNGLLASPTSEVVVLTPGTTVDLTANFEVSSLDAGKCYATAYCVYSYFGIYWAQGEKIKTFSFAVV